MLRPLLHRLERRVLFSSAFPVTVADVRPDAHNTGPNGPLQVIEGDVEITTNGLVLRELIVDVDHEARRVVWSAIGGSLTHHNASAQVFPEGQGRTRFVWIADLLPHEAAGTVAAMMDQGLSTIKRTLEQAKD